MEKKEKSKLVQKYIIFSIAGILIILIALASYIIYKNSLSSNGTDNTNLNNTVSYSNINSSFISYSGKYLSASLLPGWTLREYIDINGMVAAPNAVYSGLTGWELQKNGVSIFTFKGVSGIDTSNVCNNIYKFDDTSTDYISNQEALINQMQSARPGVVPQHQYQVISLSNNYSQLQLFGKTLRRIDSDLYWNAENTDSKYFNPDCALNDNRIKFTKPFFNVSSTNSSKGIIESYYQINIQKNNITNPEDLVELDQILKTVKVNE